MPRQIPKNLPIIGRYDPFVAFHLTPEELTGRYEIEWERFEEDGLGLKAVAGFFLDSGGYYMLEYLHQAPRPATVVLLAHETENPEEVVEGICVDFGFTSADLEWVSPELRFSNFELYCQDDNGVEFCVGRFPLRADAVAKMRELAAGGHKQFYEVRKAADNSLSLGLSDEGFTSEIER